MPWQEVTRVSAREEFVQLAMQVGSNRRELCRRFGISPQTGYKWLARYTLEGLNGLCERSRRPRHSPARTVDEVAERVIQLRRESRNSWGGRKLARLLAEEGGPRRCAAQWSCFGCPGLQLFSASQGAVELGRGQPAAGLGNPQPSNPTGANKSRNKGSPVDRDDDPKDGA
jgi:transposase